MGKPSPENLRIREVRDFVLKRIKKFGEMHFLIYKLPKSLRGNSGIDFQVSRSGRKTEDPKLFVIYYNPDSMTDMTRSRLIVNLFHEILHAFMWDYEDEYAHVIKYIKQKNLKKELKKRNEDASERVTYDMVRHLGPVLFPEVNPEDWEPEINEDKGE